MSSADDERVVFYPTQIDGHHASILVDLRWEDEPLAGADTLYRARIAMLDPGDHGMGTADEMSVSGELEDELAAKNGVVFVGHVRSGGIWELQPNSEQRHWIGDYGVVERLAELDDAHDVPRRVDHWAYFDAVVDRDRFVECARLEGFDNVSRGDGEDEAPHMAQVFRADPVAIDHIHAVVMQLVELAAEHHGEYDGWETFVVRGGELPEGD